MNDKRKAGGDFDVIPVKVNVMRQTLVFTNQSPPRPQHNHTIPTLLTSILNP